MLSLGMDAGVPSKIDALGPRQLGLLTRAQARAAGLSSSGIDRRLKAGVFEVAAPGVYRLRSGPSPSLHQRLLAICLSLGPGTVASHRTAAWLWGLDRFDREPNELEVTTVFGHHATIEGVRIHQRRGELAEGLTHRSSVPVTVRTRTLLDLARVLPDADLEIALDSAARFRPDFFVELDELLGTVKPTGRTGIHRLFTLLKLRRQGTPTGSVHETLVFRELRRAGIELPVLQHRICRADRSVICVPDFAWPRKQIALFVDSGYHVGKRARTDAAQRLEITKLGWRPIVVMRDMLDKGGWISSFAELFWPQWPTLS